MIAKTIIKDDKPEINNAYPNLEAVVGSLPRLRSQANKPTIIGVSTIIKNGLID